MERRGLRNHINDIYIHHVTWKGIRGSGKSWKSINKDHCALVVCFGDFNIVQRSEERQGISANPQVAREIIEFNQFIEETKLINISMVGRNFTWYRSNRKAKSQIDRVLISREWLECWLGNETTRIIAMISITLKHVILIFKWKLH